MPPEVGFLTQEVIASLELNFQNGSTVPKHQVVVFLFVCFLTQSTVQVLLVVKDANGLWKISDCIVLCKVSTPT